MANKNNMVETSFYNNVLGKRKQNKSKFVKL